MTASPTDGLYYQFCIPLGLFNLIHQVMGGRQSDPNVPQTLTDTGPREWFSQPRVSTDETTEVITTNFKLPLSISEVSFEVLRVSSRVELWYLDRQNNWRQILDEARIPAVLHVAASSQVSWYKAHFYCYPIVAKAVQFRITRTRDLQVGNQPYCVGMRNGLLRRNIYTRADGTLDIEPQQDVLGNTYSSYLKDWDAPKAVDNRPNTFWRSMPMPDPMAVASLYLDVRTPDGGPQLMDALYLDPVHTGQQLNLYYSNDDTQGTLKLSPITAVSDHDENTEWRLGVGRWDTSIDPGSSDYRFPMAWGPLISQNAWIGIEWAPDFDPTAGPAANPVLFDVTPTTPTTGQFTPTISYDVGAAEIVLEFTDGTTTHTFNTPVSPLFMQHQPLRIVAGWRYGDPNEVYISARLPNGTEVAQLSESPSDLPTLMSLDGAMGFSDFRGLFLAHVVKLESHTVGGTAFQANPTVYVAPDPVMPDPSGNIPTTTLDNAIYAAAWTMQSHGTGGGHESRYDNKTWTPIWRNYISQKGKLLFPQQVRAKYLKLEFTSLAEEPYPVYDAGVQTSYRVYPVSVTQDVTKKHLGLLGIGMGMMQVYSDIALSGIGSVNWLNPTTINNAVNAVFGPVVNPVMIQSGAGTTIPSMPGNSTLDVVDQTRQELSSPWVYRRSQPDATTLAGQLVNMYGKDTLIGAYLNMANVYTEAVTDAYTPLMNWVANPSSGPYQGDDYWVFPGGTLRMPATVMNGLAAVHQTIYGRPPTTETRLRFNSTSVHRYDIKTVTREHALAYFAGVAEVQPLLSTHVPALDPPQFTFTSYDPSQWVMTNTRSLDSGPFSTAGHVYEVINPGFDISVLNWEQVAGEWTHDPSDVRGHWHPGSATVILDGEDKVLRSSWVDVAPGVHLDASVWVFWRDLVAADDTEVFQLHARYYNNDTFVSSEEATLSFSEWEADGDWAKVAAELSEGTGFTVPSGVNKMRLDLVATEDGTAGQVWFDTVEIDTTDSVSATAFKSFITTSTFSKIRCEFTDSGVVRSNSMWARQDPLDLNIPEFELAYYTTTIPDVIPAGMWGDTFAGWGSEDITWGAPRAVVAINVDPDRIYDGKRVLHFSRAGGVMEAGVKVRQMTNFIANGLFRIGAVFFKPHPNDNEVVLRLRRASDGVYVHEEAFRPAVGFWYEYVTDFIEIPDSTDQIYTVELVCTGDDPDEFYLNDIYTEIAGCRYFMRVGDSSSFLHDVTQLRYADSAVVSTTNPTNEFSIQAVVLSPKFWCYGVSVTPLYLR